MIPLYKKQSIRHIDKDGVTFVFAPKNASLELELIQLYERVAGSDTSETPLKTSEQISLFAAFADKILLGCEGSGLEEVGKSEKPSAVFNSQEISSLITMWNEANAKALEETTAA
jgi:hypothetical protein